MKKVAAKVITIFSQLLVASVFLFLLFSSENTNNENIIINNNNLNKMADKTLFLFDDSFKVEGEDTDVIVDLTTADEEKEVKEEVKEKVKVETPTDDNVTSLEPDFMNRAAIETFTGTLTGYGPDCVGCGGKTSTGHNLYDSVYYEDSEFGMVRIVAADAYFPFYSIIRISNVPGMDTFLAIVLDRGGNVGFNNSTLFDLAFSTERDPSIIGLTGNVTFDVLRRGN